MICQKSRLGLINAQKHLCKRKTLDFRCCIRLFIEIYDLDKQSLYHYTPKTNLQLTMIVRLELISFRYKSIIFPILNEASKPYIYYSNLVYRTLYSNM